MTERTRVERSPAPVVADDRPVPDTRTDWGQSWLTAVFQTIAAVGITSTTIDSDLGVVG